jgi:hypothetical protein
MQTPKPGALEVSFPKLVFDRRVTIAEKEGWEFKGKWGTNYKDNHVPQARFSAKAGDEAVFNFEGTGVSIAGNWNNDCGKADIYVDGKLKRTIDNYFDFSTQHPGNVNLFLMTNLDAGKHTVRLVVKGEKRNESAGTNIYLTEAVVYHSANKTNEGYTFSFQR